MALLLLIFAAIVAVPSFVGPFFWNLGKASADLTKSIGRIILEFFFIMYILSCFIKH